jgi:hypothetical protein
VDIKHDSLVLEDEIIGISWNGAGCTIGAEESLGFVCVLLSATVTQSLHSRIDFLLEDFAKLNKLTKMKLDRYDKITGEILQL